ncbi:MAG TPA: hypothetical protein VJA27_02830 [Patescibacteria group bacterium]|nr:hypothetical protein [Patescibacteria group bacterium]
MEKRPIDLSKMTMSPDKKAKLSPEERELQESRERYQLAHRYISESAAAMVDSMAGRHVVSEKEIDESVGRSIEEEARREDNLGGRKAEREERARVSKLGLGDMVPRPAPLRAGEEDPELLKRMEELRADPHFEEWNRKSREWVQAERKGGDKATIKELKSAALEAERTLLLAHHQLGKIDDGELDSGLKRIERLEREEE